MDFNFDWASKYLAWTLALALLGLFSVIGFGVWVAVQAVMWLASLKS